MLPLWKTRAMATPLRGTSRAIYVLRPLPHRHRIAGIAAVVSYSEKMYYLHAESQEKYFEDVIRLHKSGCSNGAISRLLPVDKTTVSKWISIFVREKGQIMRVKRTEKLVDPDGLRVPEPSMDEMESLRRRVKELESQLLQTEIKAEAYDEMIRVAESKFGIPIRKKAGAKQ